MNSAAWQFSEFSLLPFYANLDEDLNDKLSLREHLSQLGKFAIKLFHVMRFRTIL